MVRWERRRNGRWPARGHIDLWIAIAIAAALVAYQLYQHWHVEPGGAIIGKARIIDGDTIDIAGKRIRLEGIDAPELDQTCISSKGATWACGRAAARELGVHIRGQELTCRHRALDRYHRVLAVCSLPDGSGINSWMVQQGWAVASGFERTYNSEEREARSASRGIWAGSFMPPWQWRQRSE